MSNKAYCPRCDKREILQEMSLVHLDIMSAYWLCMLCGFVTKPMIGKRIWIGERWGLKDES